MKRARHLRMHHFRFRRPIRRGKSARVMWKFCRAALMGPSYFRRTAAYITWRRRTRLRYMNLWMRHRATVLGVASTESSKVGEPSSERVVLYVMNISRKSLDIDSSLQHPHIQVLRRRVQISTSSKPSLSSLRIGDTTSQGV